MDTEQKPLNSGFGAKTTAAELVNGVSLHEKIVIVTGGHAGLGLETTKALAKAGALVIVGARDVEKAQKALEGVRGVKVSELDLSSPASIDQFAKTFINSNRALDILINNAGIMATPLLRDQRGYEMQFSTNHLGHFQLTARLWPALKKARTARVISLSSAGHRFASVDLADPNFTNRPYDKWIAYGQSKSANSLFAVALDQRGKPFGIRAFAVHPGRIATDLLRHMGEEELKSSIGFDKNIEQGAATTVWAATSPQLADKGGVYCADCDISELIPDDGTLSSGVRRWAIDKPTAKGLWDLSEKLLGLRWPE